MAAFTREVECAGFGIERHAQLFEPADRFGCVLDHEFNRVAPIEPGAGDHGVADMVIEGVAFVEHGGDAALCPRGRSAIECALRQHQHAAAFSQHQCGGESGGAGADDQHIRAGCSSGAHAEIRGAREKRSIKHSLPVRAAFGKCHAAMTKG